MSYIHRIGRTGRGGKPGQALTLFTDDDKPYVRGIATLMQKSGDTVPEWMLKLPACDNKAWKKMEKAPPKRKAISTRPKEQIPKRFLKQMEKNMKRSRLFDQRNGLGEEEGDGQAEEMEGDVDGEDAADDVDEGIEGASSDNWQDATSAQDSSDSN